MCWRFQDKVGVKGEIVVTHNGAMERTGLSGAAEPDVLAPAELDRESAAPHHVDLEIELVGGIEQADPATGPHPPSDASAVEIHEPARVADQETALPSDPPEDDRTSADDTFTVERGVRLSAESCECAEVVVGGVFESAIRARCLRVEAGGRFVGRVIVEQADIAGTVEGELTVLGKLVVHATGTVSGRTLCREMVIELGGFIAGEVHRLSPCAPGTESPNHSTGVTAPANEIATVA